MKMSITVGVLTAAMIVAVAPAVGAEPEKLPKATVEAWDKQKHQACWFGSNWDSGTVSSQFALDVLEPNGIIPGFTLARPNVTGRLADLPEPDRPFGVEVGLSEKDGPFLAELKRFKNLTRVQVFSGSPLPESDLMTLAEMPQLEELQLWGCKVSDAGLKTLSKLKNLRRLGLRGTKVTDEGLAALKDFDKLEHLELGSNLAITDKGVTTLAGLKSLKYLDLHLTKVTDEGAKTLAAMGHLRGLYMANTRLTPAGLKMLGALKDLELFHIDGQNVTADTIDAVAGMTKLTHLGLSIGRPDKTSAGDAEFKKLANLKGLRHLNTFGWQVTDASLPVVRGFERLAFIDLRYSQIKIASAKKLQEDLPKCRIFPPY